MSPPYMPFYVGDYLSATQHLGGDEHGAYFLLIMHCWQGYAVPEDDAARAKIVRFPLKRWLAMRDTVMAFFEPDGTQRRVTMELSKATAKSAVRQVAGSIGGMRSAVARSKQMLKQTRSKPPPNGKQTASKIEANDQANAEQNSSKAQAFQNQIHKENTSSESEAARARSDEMPTDQQDNEQTNPAGSLATALCGGALTRPPDAEQASLSKPPSEVTRAELEATFERKREREAQVAADRRNRVWGRSQPPAVEAEKQEPAAP